MAMYDQNGKKFDKPVFPWSLRFEPHTDVKNIISKNFVSYNAYIKQLIEIPEHSHLYRVYATDAPKKRFGSEKYIGDIVLDGDLVHSKFGDEQLFFRHQKMDEDLKHKPEWESLTPKWGQSSDSL